MVLAITSLVVFQYRFWRQFKQPAKHKAWWPHLIDSLLLLSGVTLAFWARFNPLEVNWLGLKLLCLVLYIGLGGWAMKAQGRTALLAYVLATATAVQILILATQKQPWPF